MEKCRRCPKFFCVTFIGAYCSKFLFIIYMYLFIYLSNYLITRNFRLMFYSWRLYGLWTDCWIKIYSILNRFIVGTIDDDFIFIFATTEYISHGVVLDCIHWESCTLILHYTNMYSMNRIWALFRIPNILMVPYFFFSFISFIYL